MKIHKEGILIIFIALTLVVTLNLVAYWLLKNPFWNTLLAVASAVFFLLIVWFFRDPHRDFQSGSDVINCPADGKVVVIEEVLENEYFHDRRIQVSIFMSVYNVHINRYPVSGQVVYSRYHPGDYLVAWHPKSSELNERSSVVLKDVAGHEVLVRQIAGAVARRIVTNASEGMQVEQGQELGFIKFGSRVDLFLPLGTEVGVKIGQKVKGNVTVIGKWAD